MHWSMRFLPIAAGVSLASAQWQESQKLHPSDAAEEDLFGYSVAAEADRAVVGAVLSDASGSSSGAAYVFDLASNEQMFKLIPDDGDVDDNFGWACALADGIAVVGTPLDDDNGLSSGSAYLFDVNTSRQLAKLRSSDGTAGDVFGYSVALHGELVLVGSRGAGGKGAAYLFDATTGGELAKFSAADGWEGDLFGSAVALDDGIAIIGAPGDDDAGVFGGSAYLFDSATGRQIAKLLPDVPADNALFGQAVAIDAGIALVGSRGDYNQGTWTGAVYVYDAATGERLAKLGPEEGDEADDFGYAVALQGTTAVIGAIRDDDRGLQAGAVYIFDTTTGAQLQKITAADGAADDVFGSAVAISGDTAIFTAPNDDDNGSRSGSAYVFVLCAADLTGDGAVDSRDVIAFLRLWAAGDSAADWDGDGDVDTQDVIAYLGAWVGGC